MSFPDPSHQSSPQTSSRVTRVQQSAWGPSAPHQTASRRGLTPLSTGQPPSQARSGTASPSRGVLSPTNSSFNPLPAIAPKQVSSRQPSVSSSSSLFSPLVTGAHTNPQTRSRNATASGSPRLGNSNTGGFATLDRGGPGASGGIGGSRLARQSPSLSASAAGSPTLPTAGGAGSGAQLTSLVITQLNILLSTIKEDKDRSKWEIQADKIWKLVDANGMEVFVQYFRRLLQSNAAQIFASTRSNDAAGGTYQLLVNEMQKLATDPDQASKIAESIDTSEGDLFKDFDLATFMDHFGLNPIIQTSLTLACKTASKPDLKAKAEVILANNLEAFISSLSDPTDIDDIIPPPILATIIDRLVHNPPRNFNEDKRSTLQYAVQLRYNKLNQSLPYAVGAAMALVDLTLASQGLLRLIQQAGPRSMQTPEACKDLLARVEANAFGFSQVANALLYMAITDGGDKYDLTNFVTAVRQHRSGQRLDWQDVASAFDRQDLRVTKPQFLSLYNALLPVAKDVETFEVQALWGGTWNNPDTQLSFVVAFLSTTSSELDVTQIPRLRTTFSVEEFADASDEIKEHAAKAVSHPMVSYEATQALFTIIFSSQEAYNSAQSLGVPEAVINANTDVFVCAASAVAKPWTPLQEQALKQLLYPFFTKALPNHDFVMHALWTHDKTWLAARFIEHYNQNPKILTLIFDRAREQHWIDTLIGIRNDFGLDFTALAHSKGLVDIEKWTQDHMDANKVPAIELSRAIIAFLKYKVNDELQSQRDGDVQMETVPLKVKTVYALLNVISGTVTEQEEGAIQRACIQAYPRLINYDYKFDHIIDANGENGNALSEEADAKMQEQYKDMYSGDADARKMINTLRTLRDSEAPPDQELFACMIHGLFDEYNCFGEYPLEALATTAVLFGGIINFGILHSRITLSVALFMVVDAIAGYAPDDSMYKFGLQASLHFIGRLEEWPQLCERLCRIPGLRGTEVYTKAEEIVRGQAETKAEGTAQKAGTLNGDLEAFDAETGYQPFASINIDAPTSLGRYEEPDEDTSDKVTFVLNNVSKRNIDEKFRELEVALQEPFHQWFAAYLVDNLAKSQPNFQLLYLQLLDRFDRKMLWVEVIRETYVSIAKIANAEATLTSSNDRTNLKNLATWLGLLTLKRNQPILHRNISFRDLLIEAHQTQRLIIALPFTCKTLSQAADSDIFKPPNPWTMEVVGLLMELYHFAELKLNFKFEIEVLCKELGLNHKDIEPTDIIRSLPLTADDASFLQNNPSESMDGFGDMLGLSKRNNERLTAQEVMRSLPDLSALLTFPPAPGNVNQQQIKSVFLTATQRAIQEIIAPVVDRSVTIAAISTSQLVEKDFAMEPDAERLQQAAHQVVKALSGSLALVTCKEPLRMSIMNSVRSLASQNLADQLPEGSILMFLNDNLDTICKVVEDSAESHSVSEINAQLEHAVESRRRHRQVRPHEPFNDPLVSRWAFFVPEPYRQEQGGLNQHQLAIYEEFGRHLRVPPVSHTNNISQDSSRQIPDVLGEGYLAHMQTPAEAPALPRQAVQQQLRMQPPTMQGQQGHGQVNGYVDPASVADRVQALLEELQHAAREAPEDHIRDLPVSCQTRDIFDQLFHLVASLVNKDELATPLCQRVIVLAFTEAKDRLEIEVLVQFANQLCTISGATACRITMFINSIEDERVYHAAVFVCLLKAGMVSLPHVDSQVSKALQQRRMVALDFFSELIDDLLHSEQPGPLRADFALSMVALAQWSMVDENPKVREIIVKLEQPASMPGDSPEAHNEQLESLFEEWAGYQRSDIAIPETILAAFILQLHTKKYLETRNDYAALLNVACEVALESFDQEVATTGLIEHGYIKVDALAKLAVSLVVYSQATKGIERIVLLEDILCILVLLMNHSYELRGEAFNPRVFFRLFSTLFIEFSASKHRLGEAYLQVPLKLAEALLALQPSIFPGFASQWIALIAHRKFVIPLMQTAFLRSTSATPDNSANGDVGPNALSTYTKLICAALSYLGRLNDSIASQDLYRATLRILCIIQHDYPELLADNHLFLDAAIPDSMIQLYNVINCANPVSIEQLPDPFTPGLKINRLDEVRRHPSVNPEVTAILEKAGVQTILEGILSSKDGSPINATPIIEILGAPPRASEVVVEGAQQALLANAIMISIGSTATVASSTFSASAPEARLLEGLISEASPKVRYVLISAMTNQIRFPSSHTHYFSTATLHLFTVVAEDVQQQLARVLVERLMVARPHPWGLIVTVLELIKNGRYNIFEQRWMKTAPEVERMLLGIAQAQQQQAAQAQQQGNGLSVTGGNASPPAR